MENENHTGKNTSDLLASKRHAKVKSRHEGINDSRKSRSTINRKYSERYKKSIFNNKIHIFLIFLYTCNISFLFFSMFCYNFQGIDIVTKLIGVARIAK